MHMYLILRISGLIIKQLKSIFEATEFQTFATKLVGFSYAYIHPLQS